MGVFQSVRRRLRQSELAWQALNAPARMRFWRSGRSLTPTEGAAVRSLREQGIARADARELIGRELYEDLEHLAAERWQEKRSAVPAGRPGAKTSFLVDLWGSAHTLDLQNPFIRFSLSRSVLGIVNAYLGMYAKFREFFLQATVPRPGAETAIASQRWHADPDDRKIVKVFLYLNDVDETAGPFTYIRHTHGRGKWRKLFPYAPKRHSRHPDPLFIERMIPKEDITVATGKAGTLIFCDTSGIHRGGYATARERIMYTSVYTTPASYLPTRFSYPPDFNPALLTLPARYAVSPKRL